MTCLISYSTLPNSAIRKSATITDDIFKSFGYVYLRMRENVCDRVYTMSLW